LIKLTFSWDDGAIEDLKLMDLSLKYKIPGIFFIPARNNERKVIQKKEIKILANNGFEIGAHTYSHSSLTKIKLEKAEKEIYEGKLYLQDVLGQEIPHFCFPNGKYNSDLITLTKKYFWSARTADIGALINNRSFLVKPTLHFYDRGKQSLLYNSLMNSSAIFKIILRNIFKEDYFSLIQTILAELSISDNVNHINIWGHSWEFERFNLWDRLETLFTFINKYYPSDKIPYSDLLPKQKYYSQIEEYEI